MASGSLRVIEAKAHQQEPKAQRSPTSRWLWIHWRISPVRHLPPPGCSAQGTQPRDEEGDVVVLRSA